MFLSCFSPLLLVLVQVVPSVSPNWYYCAGAITGLVNWITVALSSLSDVMPPRWRAPSFGLLLAGFSLGFALAPQLALVLGHLGVAVFALSTVLVGLIVTVFYFPETLTPEQAHEAVAIREALVEGLSPTEKVLWTLKRPIFELSILNRNRLFRLLSLLAFFSGMVTSGDRTLIIYYIEERLGFTDSDIAFMFLIMGILGKRALVHSWLGGFAQRTQPLTLCSFRNICSGCGPQGIQRRHGGAVGRHPLLLSECDSQRSVRPCSRQGYHLCGGGNIQLWCHGVSNHLGHQIQQCGTSLPCCESPALLSLCDVVSPVFAQERSEQGRIQGALYSLSALAGATGPMVMRWVYHYTKDGSFVGPGSMFIVAALLDAFAVLCAYALPVRALFPAARCQVVPFNCS